MSETDRVPGGSHYDGPRQKLLETAVAALLLRGFFHVSEVCVRRNVIELHLETDSYVRKNADEKERPI
jgi:hypothetical protein